jgi:flagellar operon protein (TIGR03826 family)
MSLDSLANCPRCGKLFVKGIRTICPDCFNLVEEEYKKVYEYVRNKENRRSTIYEVSEATGVSVRQITEFVRSGRLSIVDYPNLAYPCDSCGENLVLQGNLCEPCRERLAREIRNTFEDERKRHEAGKHAGKGYLQIGDHNNKPIH